MATLMGLQQRLVLPRVEVVSDKQDGVLVIERAPGNNYVTITIRKPWEATWNASGPSFQIEDPDVTLIAAALSGHDAAWTIRNRRIPSDTFAAPDVNEDAVAKEVEARCSQLDIERAKAVNLEEEKALLRTRMSVDHVNDKHGNYEIDGCELCQMRTRSDHGDGSLPYESIPSVYEDNNL